MATAVTFLEPGTDATQDLSFFAGTGLFGGTCASASDQAHTGSRSLKVVISSSNTAAYAYTNDGVVADAGSALSVWVRFSTAAPSVATAFLVFTLAADGDSVFAVGLNTNGTLAGSIQATGGTSFAVNGTHAVSANTWTRIAVSYVITSTTSWNINIYVNGTLDIQMSFALNGAISSASHGTSDVEFGVDEAQSFSAATSVITIWYDDLYIDNRSDLSDPGNVSVTAKRPFANGTTNGFSTTGTPSGYGSGHAPYVNGNYPVGSDTTTYCSVVVVASAITEEYNIEGSTVGDVSLSGATILGVQGWIFASSTLTETDKILVDGTQTSKSVTSTATLFVQNSPNPTTYPAGTGSDIGMVTNTTAATAKLFGAGILVAFIPATNAMAASGSASAALVGGNYSNLATPPLSDTRPFPFLPGGVPPGQFF